MDPRKPRSAGASSKPSDERFWLGEQRAERAAELALAHGYDDVQARLKQRESNWALWEMRLDESRALALSGYEVLDRLGRPREAAVAFYRNALTILLGGDLDRGEAAYTEVLDYIRQAHIGGPVEQ